MSHPPPLFVIKRRARARGSFIQRQEKWHSGIIVSDMFFRRETPREPSFAERIESLKKFGFRPVSPWPPGAPKSAAMESAPSSRSARPASPCQQSRPDRLRRNRRAGQSTAIRCSGKHRAESAFPALATQLKSLHNFEEDLKEALGLPSLYNQSLGTTSDLHLYDRVEHRDEAPSPKPWDHKPAAT